MTDGREKVRAGVLGAPKAAHLSVVEGGGGEKNAVQPLSGRKARGGRKGNDGPPSPALPPPSPESTCPLVPLGHQDGVFHFLDIDGQKRQLSARQMGSRSELVTLFVGEGDWLMKWFPRVRKYTETVEGVEAEKTETIGMNHAAAGECLMRLCRKAGLYGPHVVLRGPGVWRGDDGSPVVHVGDYVLSGDRWAPSGYRGGNQVWRVEWPAPRPGAPRSDGEPSAPGDPGFAAPASVAQQLQATIRDLWSFRNPGADIVVLGLMGIGYYGAAARWRANGYLIGGTGSGKSLLLDLLRACVPAHSYSTDTTKSGIENAIDGRPSGVFIDEAGDRVDQRGAQNLLDFVLSASSNDGTKGLRGTMDGRGRSFEVRCNVIMATVNPPDMGPQHRDRFTVVDLRKPGAGEDHRAKMEAAAAWAKEQGPALWGRAIEGWDRWLLARDAYRAALARAQCAAREMDQIGAILATWWVLAEDGVPTEAQALDGVGAIGAFIRGAAAVALEDGPRRMVQHLAGRTIQRDRSTDLEQVGVLVRETFEAATDSEADPTRRLLMRSGIRVIRATDLKDKQQRPVPRGADGDGIWFGRTVNELRALFGGTVWDGDRWTYEMLRHPSAVEWRHKNVRIGGVSGPAIWISRADWDPPDDD